jgi:hypothetical protein
MRGGVPWHHSSTAFYIYNNAMLLRMDEMPYENVGLRERRYTHYSVDIPGYRFIGSQDGIVSSGSKCLYSLGTALPIICLCCSLSLPTPTPLLRLTLMPLNLKTLLLPLPTTALRLRLSVSGMHCIQYRGSYTGSGSVLEH